MEEWNQWRLFLNSGSVLDYLAYKRAKEMEDTGAGACRASRRGFGEIGLTKKSDESRVIARGSVPLRSVPLLTECIFRNV